MVCCFLFFSQVILCTTDSSQTWAIQSGATSLRLQEATEDVSRQVLQIRTHTLYLFKSSNWLDTEQLSKRLKAMFRREPLKTGATKNRKLFPLCPCAHRVLKQSTLPVYTAIKDVVVFFKYFTLEPALRGAGTPSGQTATKVLHLIKNVHRINRV